MKPRMFVLLPALLLVTSQAAALSAVATDALFCEACLRQSIIRKTIPPYPREALESGAQGRVIAEGPMREVTMRKEVLDAYLIG